MSEQEDPAVLTAAGDFLARLLLLEPRPGDVERMRSAPLADGLAALGLALPEGEAERVAEELAADYFARFLGTATGRPLVQSLWEEGRYDAGAAARLRRLAAELDFEHDAGSARGAPIDHLGSILLLHGELARRGFADLAAFRASFLAWAPRALRASVIGSSFYDRLLARTADYVELLGPEVS